MAYGFSCGIFCLLALGFYGHQSEELELSDLLLTDFKSGEGTRPLNDPDEAGYVFHLPVSVDGQIAAVTLGRLYDFTLRSVAPDNPDVVELHVAIEPFKNEDVGTSESQG